MPTAGLRALWRDVYDSLWFFPAVFTIGAIALATVLVRADALLPESIDRRTLGWLFSGGAEGARGVLAAIAGSLITVTGVVFSVTIVALQLASSQYTPRVLRTFMADRANQLVLAVFIGTFVYSLVVMRTIYSAGEDYEQFVPAVATTAGVLLAILAIGCLIFYIHHAATSLQVDTILGNVTTATLHAIRSEYPDESAGPEAADEEADDAGETADGAFPVTARKSGYITALDRDRLRDVARETSAVVRVAVRVGDFVFPGTILAVLHGGRPSDDACDDVRDAFAAGAARTPHQDVLLGFVELVDIAVKALSPGINDPHTATSALNRLGETLLELGRRHRRNIHRSENGATVVLRLPGWEETVSLAFDQIAHYGAGDASLIAHLAETIGRVGSLLPESRRPALRDRLARARLTAREQLVANHDRVLVDRAVAEAEKLLERPS